MLGILDAYKLPIVDAALLFPILAVVLFIPICVVHYRRFGKVRPLRAIVFYSFAFYLLCAFFLTLLPLPEITDDFCERHASTSHPQLVPFASFVPIFAEGHHWGPSGMLANRALLQVVFNAILLLPLGFYLRYLYSFTLARSILTGFAVSLLFEVTQLTGVYGLYPCPFRLFDVDDLMLNTLGAGLGWLLVPIFRVLPDVQPHPNEAVLVAGKVTLFRRAIAFVIDWTLLGSLMIVPSLFGHGVIDGSYWHMVWRTVFLLVVFVIIPHQFHGATLGMWLCRCKIVIHGMIGEGVSPLRIRQLGLRAGIFFGLPACAGMIAHQLAQVNEAGFVDGFRAIAALSIQGAVLCLFVLPMIFRHDHRGIHEWVSGTVVGAADADLANDSVSSPGEA